MNKFRKVCWRTQKANGNPNLCELSLSVRLIFIEEMSSEGLQAKPDFFFLFLFLGPHLTHGVQSLLCAQRSLLVDLRELYSVPEIELVSALCKANNLSIETVQDIGEIYTSAN